MENLFIKHNTLAKLRKGLGILSFACGVIWIIISIDTPKAINIINGVLWILIGTTNFIANQGTDETTVQPGEDYTKIKWMNRLRSKTIPDSELQKITIKRYQIIIDRKGKKPLELPVDFFEPDQKRLAYSYFIELAKQKNISLENKVTG